MATALLTTQPGSVKFIALPHVEGIGVISLNPDISGIPAAGGISTINLTAVITEFKFDQAVNVQFQRSLHRAVYAYTFGDSLGDLIVSGLVFNSFCTASGSTRDSSGHLAKILEYYAKNKLSSSLDPIKITFAGNVVEGRLIGLNISSNDVMSYSCNFSLVIKTAANVFV